MEHDITITVSDEVYRGLQTVLGSRTISEFFDELARPVIMESCLESDYQQMALDSERESEASKWVDGLAPESVAGDRDVAQQRLKPDIEQ